MDNVQVSVCLTDSVALLKLLGRTTLDYADQLKTVGLLLISNGASKLKFELSECQFMDSTVMGVLAMLSLECLNAQIPVEVVNASNEVQNLLKGLGIHRVVKFTTEDLTSNVWKDTQEFKKSNVDSRLVLDAHECLIGIDESNKGKFAQVVELLKLELTDKE